MTRLQPLLVIAIVLVSGISAYPQDLAFAQDLSIGTSVDTTGGTFFGEGVVRIVIADPNADDDSTVEDISVSLSADPDSGSQVSITVTVPETSSSSGRFEFYLAHVNADLVAPEELDSINSAGVEGDNSCISGCAPFVTFGATGDLQVDADLYDNVSFDISAGDITKRVEYEETLAQLELDRSNYGSDSFVYVYIYDQDANLNPTANDEFLVDSSSPPNDDLLVLSGGEIQGSITFKESGDNTARFEGRYRLSESMIANSEALVLTMFDKANYANSLEAAENDSNDIDEVSFTIGNSDGTIDVGGNEQETWDAVISSDKATYGLGEAVKITVDDPDANSSSSVSEKINIKLTAPSGSAVVAAQETSQNTGVFSVEFSILIDGSITGTQLTVEEGDRVVVSYVDENPADYSERLQMGQDTEKEFTHEIRVRRGETDLPAFVTPPDVAGSLHVGAQLALSTVIENNGNSSQPFVVLLEVRDSSGVTAYLAWQSGNMVPAGSSVIEVSWTPEVPGQYELRSFAVLSLEEGSVISEVARNTATVS